jgi:hypothetical protein
MTDQGRSALAERLPLAPMIGAAIRRLGKPNNVSWERDAAAILGEHGLFIADASKHEPVIRTDDDGWTHLACICGFDRPKSDESYFDHLLGAP